MSDRHDNRRDDSSHWPTHHLALAPHHRLRVCAWCCTGHRDRACRPAVLVDHPPLRLGVAIVDLTGPEGRPKSAHRVGKAAADSDIRAAVLARFRSSHPDRMVLGKRLASCVLAARSGSGEAVVTGLRDGTGRNRPHARRAEPATTADDRAAGALGKRRRESSQPAASLRLSDRRHKTKPPGTASRQLSGPETSARIWHS